MRYVVLIYHGTEYAPGSPAWEAPGDLILSASAPGQGVENLKLTGLAPPARRAKHPWRSTTRNPLAS
jgi:hypothetical protein